MISMEASTANFRILKIFSIREQISKITSGNKIYTQQKFVELSLIQKDNDQIRQSNSTHQPALIRSNATLKLSSN